MLPRPRLLDARPPSRAPGLGTGNVGQAVDLARGGLEQLRVASTVLGGDRPRQPHGCLPAARWRAHNARIWRLERRRSTAILNSGPSWGRASGATPCPSSLRCCAGSLHIRRCATAGSIWVRRSLRTRQPCVRHGCRRAGDQVASLASRRLGMLRQLAYVCLPQTPRTRDRPRVRG